MAALPLASTNILIGTPCYGGTITTRYFHAILRLEKAFEDLGIRHQIYSIGNESLITRARNAIVADFLGRPDCTHLLFVDADIGFRPETIIRMIRHDKPVVAAAYPMKNIYWDEIFEIAKVADSAETLRSRAMRYAVDLGAGQQSDVVNGFIRVNAAGTGVMLIQRTVFEQMCQAWPDLAYQNNVEGYENERTRGNFWLFFDTMIEPETGHYLSEDYAFCRRWRDTAGGEVHLDIESELSHSGSFTFRGSFINKIR